MLFTANLGASGYFALQIIAGPAVADFAVSLLNDNLATLRNSEHKSLTDNGLCHFLEETA
jgi:hypothetical protein